MINDFFLKRGHILNDCAVYTGHMLHIKYLYQILNRETVLFPVFVLCWGINVVVIRTKKFTNKTLRD